jgi:hypothetical protein
MRHINFILFLIIFNTPLLHAQVNPGPNIAWQQCYGGTGEDYFTDAIITHDNGILAAIRPLSDEGDLEGMTKEEASGWVIKYNPDMSIQWQRHYGYPDCFREVYKIFELVNGEILLAGSASSNSGAGCLDVLGSTDIFLLKTDSLGNELWYKTYGSPYQDLLTWMVPTSDGGFLLTGTSMGEGSDIPFHYGSNLSTDAIVLKTDSLGELEWVRVLGGSSFDYPRKSTVEIQPNLFQLHIASTSNDFDFFDSEIDAFSRWLFVQFDLDGNIIRDRVMSAEIDFYNGSSTFLPHHGGVLAAGTGFAESPLYPTTPEHQEAEGAIIVLDSLLEISYMKQWGGSKLDLFVTATRDELGNYYFFGVSESADYDVLENHYGGEEENYWILATDSVFNTLWSKSFGGGNSSSCGDLGCGVFTGTLIAKDGMLYAFTESVSPEVLPDFDIACGHYNESVFGKSDAWLVAFDLSTVVIPEVPASDLIQIFPVPATDWLTISIPDTAFERLQVFGLDGRLFYSNRSFTQTNIQLDVSQWPVGMYTAKIHFSTGEVISKKIIVSH